MSEPQDEQKREPPHNADAERTVLGAILIDNRALDSVGRLRRDDFHFSAHRVLFDAMRKLAERGQPIDAVTLKDELTRVGALQRCGGVAYVGKLMDGVPRVSNVEPWCKIIRRHAVSRRLIALSERLAAQAFDQEAEPAELITAADAELLTLGRELLASEGPKTLMDGVPAAMLAVETRMADPYGVVGYSTGIADLDAIQQGIRPGRMGIVGARLGSGKSMLALQIAAAIAAQAPDKAVLFSSLEMDVAELVERRLASIAAVDPTRLHMADEQKRQERLSRLVAAVSALEKNILVMEDAWTLTDLRMQARLTQQQRGLSAVFVDYLDLMELPARYAKRNEGIAALAQGLRRMAKELGVPVIVVSQINREPEAGGKRRPPQMSDIAGSDDVGRAAHWALLIDLEPPPAKGMDPDSNRNVADVYVRKNRGGRKGKCQVRFAGGIASFQLLDRGYE